MKGNLKKPKTDAAISEGVFNGITQAVTQMSQTSTSVAIALPPKSKVAKPEKFSGKRDEC